MKTLDWKKLEERDIGYGERQLFLPGAGFGKDLFVERYVVIIVNKTW